MSTPLLATDEEVTGNPPSEELESDYESAFVDVTTESEEMVGGVALPVRATELYLMDVNVIRST